ncbi:MAG TPA: LysE family transporter [Verrucomicrobiae bacterium]|nr:LysE family transporter [Verrucomicrobiae bacterium]
MIFPILLAMSTGLVAGLLLSMPNLGPVNLTILNTASRRGFKAGALVGLGASSMELIYCAIAFTGFTQFFEVKMIKTSMEVFSFVFFLFIGMKFLRAQSLDAPDFGAAAHKLRARVDQKFKPESAFMTGFVRVLGNFGVLLFWIFLAGSFLSHDLVIDTLASKGACIAGVALGTNFWFCSLSFAASKHYGQISEPALLRMERFSGVCLLVLGFAQGVHIAWQLARHRM